VAAHVQPPAPAGGIIAWAQAPQQAAGPGHRPPPPRARGRHQPLRLFPAFIFFRFSRVIYMVWVIAGIVIVVAIIIIIIIIININITTVIISNFFSIISTLYTISVITITIIINLIISSTRINIIITTTIITTTIIVVIGVTRIRGGGRLAKAFRTPRSIRAPAR
jgi:hypothetical protein